MFLEPERYQDVFVKPKPAAQASGMLYLELILVVSNGIVSIIRTLVDLIFFL